MKERKDLDKSRRGKQKQNFQKTVAINMNTAEGRLYKVRKTLPSTPPPSKSLVSWLHLSNKEVYRQNPIQSYKKKERERE